MRKDAYLFLSPLMVLALLLMFFSPFSYLAPIVPILLIGITLLQLKFGWDKLWLTLLKYIVFMGFLLVSSFTIALFYDPNHFFQTPHLFRLILRGIAFLCFIIATFTQPIFMVYEHQYFLNQEKR